MFRYQLRKLGRYVFAGILITCLGGCSSTERAPMGTISNFEVERYLGEWYQVAAIPAWFQSDCVANTTANYTQGKDDLVVVLNSCDRTDGTRMDAEARARFLGASADAKLEVTFVSLMGYWLWFAAGDYWIIGLDSEYQWSVVGSPSREFAWILARSPTLDKQTLMEIGQVLSRESYDPCALIMTTPEHSLPLCDLLR